MQNQQIITEVEKCLVPIIEGTMLEIYDVEFLKEGPNWYLRIYIDKPDGVTIDDCEYVSRSIEKILDARDFIPQAYMLEVSSPGLNRQLKKEKDFHKYAGHLVDVKLYRAVNQNKHYQGRLSGLVDNILKLTLEDGTELAFPQEDVASVRLSILF